MAYDIYQRAAQNGCEFEATCTSVTIEKWEQLMKGARKAARVKAVKVALMAGAINEQQAREEVKKPYYNPYRHYVTKTHVIYVNSAIEHFIKVN